MEGHQPFAAPLRPPNRAPGARALPFLLLLLAAPLVSAQDSSGEVIRRAAEVLALPRPGITGRPVEITGVVTLRTLPSPGLAVAQDGVGIFVDRDPEAPGPENDTSAITVGDLVAVSGFTFDGHVAPTIRARRIQRLGRANLPPPTEVTLPDLMTGRFAGQRVAIRGVVQRMDATVARTGVQTFDLATEGGPCRILFSGSGTSLDPAVWVDGVTRVVGVAQSLFNSRNELLGARVHFNGPESLELLAPPAPDPWSAPMADLRRLLPYSRAGFSLHRVRLRGTVLLSVPRQFLYLLDGDRAIEVETTDAHQFEPGDDVEVSGFIRRHVPVAGLENAVVRGHGHGPPPTALPVQVAQLYAMHGDVRPGDAPELHGRLVVLRGSVGSVAWINEETLAVHLRVADRLVTGVLSRANLGDLLARVQTGATVEMTGVCVIEPDSANFPALKFPSTERVRLLLRGPADLRVLRAAPWWNERRQRLLLATLAVAGAAVAVWIIALRRTVAGQRQVIERKTTREVLLEERQRMARELHDTLSQHLTGARMHIETAAEDARESGPAAELTLPSLTTAASLLRYSEEETRRITLELRSAELHSGGLVAALEDLASEATEAGPARVEFVRTGEVRRLPGEFEFHLLRIAQESVGNARRHALARRIEIALSFTPATVQLVVEDNGRGFVPGELTVEQRARFGLRGMRERAERLRGEFRLESTPGVGTRVEVTLSAPVSP